jgi:hypothetical protein
VALICNLVQEFNGLVSKGSTVMLAFLLLEKSAFFTTLFDLLFCHFVIKKTSLINRSYRFILSHTLNAVLNLH